VRNASAFLNAIAVVNTFTGREEGFPRDACRIIDPRFFGFGVATSGLAFL
jgi:hypothetical protein